MADPALIDAIDAVLPQTQCRACDYPACRPYAEAIASGEADIDRCPPGGVEGVVRLAALTGRPVIPLREAAREPAVALIREAECIGCTLCIQACPVDAIVGATKHMHTVIAAECNGCGLCLPPCPVDCIDLMPLPPRDSAAQQRLSLQWRRRYQAREARLRDVAAQRAERLAAKRREHIHESSTPDGKPVDRRAVLQAALAAARQRRRQ